MNTPSDDTLSFIGGGNMAGSIIGGLVASGHDPGHIHVADPSEPRRWRLAEDFAVHCYADNLECARQARTVILAVKPQVLREAVDSIREHLAAAAPLVISIAAGIRGADILRWIGADLPFIRVMPNTPALVGSGVSGLLATSRVSEAQKSRCEALMRAVGETVWVDSEPDIDTVTGISGSGPAYFFKLMEIMTAAARRHGLDEQQARTLVLSTARGAALLAAQSEHDPAELRRQVTSPGGTTQAALTRMEAGGIDEVISSGIDAAIDKSGELADTLGGE